MSNTERTPLVAVVGPTASGKTALAVELAKALNGEVLSFDSMQLYKGMDVATAKPTADEMQGIPHHLIDVVDPSKTYSVARFQEDAARIIADIRSRGRTSSSSAAPASTSTPSSRTCSSSTRGTPPRSVPG